MSRKPQFRVERLHKNIRQRVGTLSVPLPEKSDNNKTTLMRNIEARFGQDIESLIKTGAFDRYTNNFLYSYNDVANTLIISGFCSLKIRLKFSYSSRLISKKIISSVLSKHYGWKIDTVI